MCKYLKLKSSESLSVLQKKKGKDNEAIFWGKKDNETVNSTPCR